jgi:hypothetical protein
VKIVKKIIAAWIEQILEFDSKLEYMAYMEGLGRKQQRFKELGHEQLQSGVVRVRIMKQYNNNAFPDDAVKGGE